LTPDDLLARQALGVLLGFYAIALATIGRNQQAIIGSPGKAAHGFLLGPETARGMAIFLLKRGLLLPKFRQIISMILGGIPSWINIPRLFHSMQPQIYSRSEFRRCKA
jgi:hypothetical protein